MTPTHVTTREAYMTEQLTIDTNATEAETSPPEVHIEPAAAPEVSLSPARDPASPPVQPLETSDEDKTTTATSSDAEAIAALKAQLAALESKAETSSDRMTQHEDAMRSALLDRLGIRDKFRQYAPKVDPFSDKGRADLEEWAADNPELRDARPVPVPEFDVSAQVKSFASPHLISTESWKDSRKSARKSGGDR
jgi:hypothetical protein